MAKDTADSLSPARRFTPLQRRVTLGAVMIAFLLSALDQTIVSTAMPRIVAELKGLELYAWVTTGYLVGTTITIPIYGKLSDLYGRRPVLIVGMAIFILGSILCGLAGAFGALPLIGGGMMQLIVFRAVQGLGGGALFTSAFSVISDLYPARDRGKLSGLFGAVFGLASVLGPLIGGVLSDFGTVRIFDVAISGWRWAFYVNLPFALTGLALLVFLTPELSRKVPGRVDYLGAALMVAFLLPLLLALSVAGQGKSWASPQIVLSLGVSLAALLGFILAELKVADPLISLELFRNPVFLFTNATGLVTSMAFIGVVTFLPLYLQLGEGIAPTASGAMLIPLILGLILSAAFSGLLAAVIGRYKALLVAGAVLMTLAAFLLAQITPKMAPWDVAWRVGLLGMGLGPMQSLLSLAVQNAVDQSKIGVATGVSQFFREIGSTFGVALLGTVFNVALAHAGQGGLDLSSLEHTAVAAQGGSGPHPGLDMAARAAITHAIQAVMLAAMAISVLGVLAAALTPDRKLKAAAKL